LWIFSSCKPCSDKQRTKRKEKQFGYIVKVGSKPKEYTIKDIDLLKNLYNAGYSYTEIRKRFPTRTQHALESKLSEEGITSRIKYFRRRESNIENLFRKWLYKEGIKHRSQVRIQNYVVDFKLNNTIVEINGSYWHCDPKLYKKPKYELQKINLIKDKEKRNALLSLGYNIIYIWEHDIERHLQTVKDQFIAVLTSNSLDNKRGISVNLLRDNTEINDLIAQGKSSS
jgi:very-short-patch-repair endonuclease